MPDRPKPRKKKNKGKGKSSTKQQVKLSGTAYQTNTSQVSTSRAYGSSIPIITYTTDPTTSSHCSEGSSQEMVMDDEVETQSIIKRPPLNRSFSENSYDSCSKKPNQIESVSIQSDGEEHKNINTNLIAKEKSPSLFSIESTTGSTGSIDSQKSCDSGFIETKPSTTDKKDSFDEASEAIDTEDDTSTVNFSKDKNATSNIYREGKSFTSRKRDVLGRSKTFPYTNGVKIYPGEKGCESNTQSLDHIRSLELSMANNYGTLCNICNERPKDACFVHQKISHQFSCYKCAKKQFRINPICPVCRRKVEKITRNILA